MPEDNYKSGNVQIFLARVILSDAGTYVSVVGSTSHDFPNKLRAIPVANIFSQYFGFKECHLPEPGTLVICALLNGAVCYIIGTCPDSDAGRIDFPNRSLLGQGDASNDMANNLDYQTDLNKTALMNMGRPTDIVEGELAYSNDFGVMLGLFQQMAMLKGSELAQIQCYLLDDLVRLISHNFEHYTALGEYKIYHDGKNLLSEFTATHQPAETYGIPLVTSATGEPAFQVDAPNTIDDKTDFYKISNDERSIAIERFKVFLGTFGDFLNIILCRPDPETEKVLNGTNPDVPDTGLGQVRMSTDGGVYLRSVKEVFIEKTNWIRVPQRISAPDDPAGDDATTVDLESKVLYEFENTFTYKENPFLYFLQIRNYVAYVNDVIGYQNFVKFSKDFYVNSDVSKENQLDTISQVDPNTPTDFPNWQLRTSGVFLMPNGGITIKDAWGSAIVMEGGNIYLQPAKDLVAQPLRNLVAKVGQYTSIASQQDIDFSSTSGGMRFKSNESMYLYSDQSGIVLHANGTSNSPGTPDPTTQAITDIGGVVLKSNAGIYGFSTGTIGFVPQQDFIVSATNDCRLDAGENAQFTSVDELVIQSNNAFLMGLSFLSAGSQSIAEFAGLNATVLGQQGQHLGVVYDPKSPFVDIISGSIDITDSISSAKQAITTGAPLLKELGGFSSQSIISNLKFNFLSTENYNGAVSSSTDPIPMTMAQQEDDLSGLYGLSAWSETSVNGSYPYPGTTNFTQAYASTTGGVPNLQLYSGNDFTAKADGTPTKIDISVGSLNMYKVLTS